jgi:hypothetical protein
MSSGSLAYTTWRIFRVVDGGAGVWGVGQMNMLNKNSWAAAKEWPFGMRAGTNYS